MEQLLDYFLMGLVTILAVIGGFVVFYLAYRFFAQVIDIKKEVCYYYSNGGRFGSTSRKWWIIIETLKLIFYLPFVFFAITLIGMAVLN